MWEYVNRYAYIVAILYFYLLCLISLVLFNSAREVVLGRNSLAFLFCHVE